MEHDWWLTAAISDDSLVAELLLCLKDSIADNNDPSSSSATVLRPPLPSWGLRKLRSWAEKKKETPHRSPTTPFSYGGGASPSEGYDDSSGYNNIDGSGSGTGASHSSDRFRSKGSAGTDQTPVTTNKRPRRKKTFVELKEDESSLLKERNRLKKEIAALRIRVREQRSINESLKRIKLKELSVQFRVKAEANSTEQEEGNSTCNGESEAGSSSNGSRQLKPEDGHSSRNPIFFVPDLNMDPVEFVEAIVGGMS